MKTKLSIQTLKARALLVLLVLLVLAATNGLHAQVQVPSVISYQGRVSKFGTNHPGPTLQFKFALVNAVGTTTEWSNDGTSVNGSEPTNAMTLTVADGLFSVMLGDTAIPGMTRGIPTTAFGNRDLYLRVWVRDPGTNAAAAFQLLSPDQRLGAVGYAMISAGVINGAISSVALANGAVTAAKLAPGAVTAASLTNIIIDGSWLTNPLRLGTCTNCSRFELLGTSNCTPAITLDGCTNQIAIWDWSGSGRAMVLLDGQDSYGGGSLRLRGADSSEPRDYVTITGAGSSGSAEMSLRNSVFGSATVELLADGPDDVVGGYFAVSDITGSPRVKIMGDKGASDRGGWIGLYRPGHTAPVITFDAATQNPARIITPVIEITGGADLSENFDVRSGDGKVEPGMIVCIDPENPGHLVASTTTYDPTVAGIVSGAGGVNPGMLMGQQGTAINGKHPVALTGRVYCLVDADRGSIRPGDLITTSDTPGHGMKASDPTRSHGAIIGKAMSGLSAGKGLVLVLANLQ